jgi:hypothetical protein
MVSSGLSIALHGPFVVPYAGPAELVVEQVMRLQLREDPGALARAIAKELSDAF